MRRPCISATALRDARRCERLFFNRWLRDGTGYVHPGVKEDLLFGDLVHRVMPGLWGGETGQIAEARRLLELTLGEAEDWQPTLLPEERREKIQEWGRLLEGVLWAWHVLPGALPALRSRYRVVSAEGDLAMPFEGTLLLAKPDLVLEPLGDPGFGGESFTFPGVGYVEFKTAKEFSPQWRAQWRRNPQAWTGALGLKETGKVMEWFLVLGGKKGPEVADASRTWLRRANPLCWAYRCAGETRVGEKVQGPDGAWWRAGYTSGKGWERVSTDRFPGGVGAWTAWAVETWPQEMAELAVVEGPFEVEWELVGEWLEQVRPLAEAAVTVEWEEWAVKDPVWMDQHFPRRLEECEADRYGRRCGMHDLCHNPAVAAEPLRVFVPRVPHHELEVREWEKGGR